MQNAAVIYARCSKEEQATEGVSLQVQIQKCQAYAVLASLEVVRVVQDAGVSGGKALAARPGGQEVLRLLAEGQARHVIVLRLDRAFRDAGDALTTASAWDRQGTALHLTDMSGMALSTHGPMGRFVLCMLAGAAELERNLIRERTRAALAVKKAQGVRLGRPQKVLSQAELATLRRARELKREGLSLRAVGTLLAQEGHLTPTGSRVWHPQQVACLLKRSA